MTEPAKTKTPNLPANPDAPISRTQLREVLRNESNLSKIISTWVSPTTRNEDGYTWTAGLRETCIRFTAGQTKEIPHGLGRKIRGWRVCRVLSGSPSLSESNGEEDREKFLTLTHGGGAACYVHLEVF